MNVVGVGARTSDAGGIWKIWWPLAVSWSFMSVELPLLSAVIARLPSPQINLAALGGVVFPISLVIEAPIIMLLAASTALTADWRSYLKLRQFSYWSAGLLTVVHILVAATPFYYFLVKIVIGAPANIVEPSRIGLLIMIPWTASIAYRRFHQGISIRFGQSRIVAEGTLIRLVTDALVLALGILLTEFPGIVLASSALAAGVFSEAVYVRLRVRPLLSGCLRAVPQGEVILTQRAILQFYIPLALTPLLTLLSQVIGAAALSRMPRALDSLAAWPVTYGLLMMLRSTGFAYQEVVVSMLRDPGAFSRLRSFAHKLAIVTTTVLLLLVLTPLSDYWFRGVSGLGPELSHLAKSGLFLGLFVPGMGVLQNWYQGILVYAHRTRYITESVAFFLVSSSLLLWLGVGSGRIAGLYVGLIAFSLGGLVQTGWVWWRSRSVVT